MDESHFERSLRLETEKHNLVESIVDKARLLEEQGQLAEALAQWEILRTVYSQYPGLSFEIARVTKRREQQVRSEAKARWVWQIHTCLGSSDYARALDLLREANAEFAGDTELAELEKLARQGMQRSAEVSGVLAQGQQYVEECLSQVRRLRVAGDLDGALEQLQQGLAAHPAEPRLLQMNDTLQKESLRSALDAYRRDLDGLRRLKRDAEATANPEVLKTLCQDARALAQRHPEDAEIQLLASSVGQRLASVTQLLQSPAAPKVEATASRPSTAAPIEPPKEGLPEHGGVPEVSVARLEQLIERLEATRSRPVAPEVREGPPPSPATGPRRRPKWIPVSVGLALILIVSALGVSRYLRRRKPITQPPPSPPTEPVHLAELPLRTMAFPSDLPPAVPLPALADVEKAPKARAAKAPPAPPKPQPRPPSELETLYNLAQQAYKKGNYVEPQQQSVIYYAKRALALDPNDGYAKQLLETGVQGGKYQVEQAIKSKDLVTAHRVANAMAQLLPGRSDIAERQKDIADYEAADAKAHRPQPMPAPTISVLVFHLHSSKPQGPYCQGTLSVMAGRISYTPESATDGSMHPMSFACSDILEIRKNPHVLGHHDDFHLRTASAEVIFLPQHPPFDISALRSACSH